LGEAFFILYIFRNRMKSFQKISINIPQNGLWKRIVAISEKKQALRHVFFTRTKKRLQFPKICFGYVNIN